MEEKKFFDLLIEKYMKYTDNDINADELGYYLEYFMEHYPKEKLETKLSKKVAARIIHEFLKNVLHLPDLDWGNAAKLKDIYDCRVCSNAIAQVYVRGIIHEAEPDIFGLNILVTCAEANVIIENVIKLVDMKMSEALSKVFKEKAWNF